MAGEEDESKATREQLEALRRRFRTGEMPEDVEQTDSVSVELVNGGGEESIVIGETPALIVEPGDKDDEVSVGMGGERDMVVEEDHALIVEPEDSNDEEGTKPGNKRHKNGKRKNVKNDKQDDERDVGKDPLRVDEEEKTAILDAELQAASLAKMRMVKPVDEQAGGIVPAEEPVALEDLEPLRVNEPKVEGELVWDKEMGTILFEATRERNKRGGEAEDGFLASQERAIESLKERIPNIEELIKKWKGKIYWASLILRGDKGVNPWPSPEQAMNFLKEIIMTKESQVEVPKVGETKEVESGAELVWYDGILDDLRTITYLDHELSDGEKANRARIGAKMRNKGIKLPPLSTDEGDSVADGNRRSLRSAVVFFRDKRLTLDRNGRSRDEAMKYLRSLGIGDGVGVERKSTSMEANGEDLIKVSLLADGPEREQAMESLEGRKIGMRRFLEEMEKIAPGREEDQRLMLRAVVDWWRLSEKEKKKFPGMANVAEKHASVLGLE